MGFISMDLTSPGWKVLGVGGNSIVADLYYVVRPMIAVAIDFFFFVIYSLNNRV